MKGLYDITTDNPITNIKDIILSALDNTQYSIAHEHWGYKGLIVVDMIKSRKREGKVVNTNQFPLTFSILPHCCQQPAGNGKGKNAV